MTGDENKNLAKTAISSDSPIAQISSGNLTGLSINNQTVDVSKNSYTYFWVFIALLLGAGTAVYFVRRKKIIVKEGDDFEILDE